MYNVIIMEINEILEKNLKYIKAYDELLCEKLLAIKSISPEIQLIYTQKNEPNLAINGFPVNEQTGAQDEASRIVSSLSHNNRESIHVVMGMGFGYIFSEIVEKSNGSVILYEPNIELLRVALEMVDMSELLVKKRVFITADLDKMAKYFEKCFLSRSKTAVLGCYYYRANRVNGILDELVKKLGMLQGVYQANEQQRATSGGDYAFSVCRNLDVLEKCSPISVLENSFKNIPAIIAAAGPSLSDNLETIKKYRDRFALFGVSSSFATLMKNGISPDFVSIIEKFDSAGLVKNFPLKNVSLIAEPYVHLNVLSLPFRSKFITSSVENGANSIYNNMLNIKPFYFETKGTVAYNALYSAMYMGCNPIILVGQDLAYVDGECYSKNSPLSAIKCRKIDSDWEVYVSDLEQLKKNLFSHKQVDDERISKSIKSRIKSLNEQIINAKTVFGEDVATSQSFALFAEYYKAFSKKYSNKIKLYNTTKKGIDIGDFEYAHLEDIVKSFEHVSVENKINVKSSYRINLNLLDKEIANISSVIDAILSIREDYLKLRDELLSDEPDLKKSLLLTKNLLMSFVKINDEYIVKSKIYKEVTLESNYMLGSIDLGSDIIDLEKLKCVHRQMGIFYVNDYVRLTKVLNTLKRVRSNLNNENCITKS